nr:UDP-N-acetylmuramoyl-tripeptide--D-alanyl-D-alanine ligase [Bacteroidales bacterium]
ALKGENFDGNQYALKALEAGAAYAIVNADSDAAASGDRRVIAVPDTLKALKALANYHRRQLTVPVFGLTGTNGKTTTKELIKAVLAKKYRVAATAGNLNNDIGVPMTLLRIDPAETDIAVVEMGANHPDDIKHLVTVVEPVCGLITNVGKAHLLGFGSFEGVQKAKGQLYDFLARHDGLALVNDEDPILMKMAADRKDLRTEAYALKYEILPTTAENPFLTMNIEGKMLRTNLVGSYNSVNVRAAVAVGRHFGVSLDDAIDAIAAYVPSNNRSQMTKTERNTLIVDAYNANPSSMNAALDNFALVQADCKMALLGDMRELGEDSLKEHIAIARKAIATGARIAFVGEEFRKALAEIKDNKKENAENVLLFASSEELASYLKENPVSGAVILIKGSRGIQMEKTIPEL